MPDRPERHAEPTRSLGIAPLVPAALAVMAGVLTDRFLDGRPGTVTWMLAAVGCAMLAVMTPLRRVLRAVALLVAIFALAAAHHHSRWFDLDPRDPAVVLGTEPAPAWVGGLLADVPEYRVGDGDEGYTRLVLALTKIHDAGSWRPARGRALVTVTGDATGHAMGRPVLAAGSLAAVPGPRNPGEFDLRSWARAKGIRLRMSVGSSTALIDDPQGAPYAPWAMLGRLRVASRRRLEVTMPPTAVPLAAALLLGRREAVDPDLNDAFAVTGTTHLLAISGLHLQALATALTTIGVALGASRKRVGVFVLVTTVLYALLVGLVPSVVRSAAMTSAITAGRLRDRGHRPANILALAALLTLALNPADLFDTGCRLSFLAVAVIFWGLPAWTAFRDQRLPLPWIDLAHRCIRLHRRGDPLDALERRVAPWATAWTNRIAGVLWSAIELSTAVTLAATPLTSHEFHLVSPIGIALNLILIPTTTIALWCAGATLGLSTLWRPLGLPFAWIGGLALDLTERVVRLGRGVPWGHWYTPGASGWWTAGFYAGLAALLIAVSLRRRGRVATAWLFGAWLLLPIAVGAVGQGTADDVHVLAVDHGLCVVIATEPGHAVLYDCGRLRGPSVGRRVIAPALWSRGVTTLDAVILSHADADHYDGLPDLLDRFRVKSVLIPPAFAGTPDGPARGLLELIRQRGIPTGTIRSGDSVSLGPQRRAEVLLPDQATGGTDNEQCLVIDVPIGGCRFLLTGDIEGRGLRSLTESPRRRVDAMLAPHHGGRTANPAWLYEWAEPTLVVVSRRMPAPNSRDPLAPLERQGVPVFDTSKAGAIRLKPVDDGLQAEGYLSESP